MRLRRLRARRGSPTGFKLATTKPNLHLSTLPLLPQPHAQFDDDVSRASSASRDDVAPGPVGADRDPLLSASSDMFRCESGATESILPPLQDQVTPLLVRS